MAGRAATLISVKDGAKYRVLLGYEPEYTSKVIFVVEAAHLMNPDTGTLGPLVPAGDYTSIPDVALHGGDVGE